jgi:hypothetical protein
MKRFFILLVVFIFSGLLLYSQDFEPTQIPFSFGTNNNYYLSGDSSYFKQTKFLLGWAWGYGKTMSKNMLDNQTHVGTGYTKDLVKDSVNLVINTNDVWDNGAGFGASNSQSVCYSPVLQITNPETQTNIRANDKRNSIFGYYNFLILRAIMHCF